MPEEQFQNLIERINKLEQEIESYKSHQHLGNDGSHIFQGFTEFRGKNLQLDANLVYGSSFYFPPFAITDGFSDNLVQRVSTMGITISNERGSAAEQINTIFTAGKALPSDYIATTPNKINWVNLNYAQLRLIENPQGTPVTSGPSYFAPLGFVTAARTPQPRGVGTISAGGSVMVDSEANFVPNSLQYGILSINGEINRIISNTTNTITIGTASPNSATVLGSFNSTGSFSYFIDTPMLLGAAALPWSRVFVGEDIRLGYGASGGPNVRYIKWGFGSPEGVVTASVGSLYLRFDGSTTTTLYVKTSGTGNTGWTAK